ncbi:MAG: threonylcarbamoyl-AMP synthase [Gammaproteobacteria bacterium]|nr:threonylcarbamoyl-AMP synthase [Gammaproteobacteria bacterium]
MPPWRLQQAVRCLHKGGILAYPTESVYGLGCDPFNPEAVQHLLTLKGRSQARGLILIASDFSQLSDLLMPLPTKTMRTLYRSWPGHVTWVCPAHPEVPIWLRGRHTSLAVRVTAHPLAAALCQAWGGPLISTSANLSGHPPARNPLQVRKQFAQQIDMIIYGDVGTQEKPSVIKDALNNKTLRR